MLVSHNIVWGADCISKRSRGRGSMAEAHRASLMWPCVGHFVAGDVTLYTHVHFVLKTTIQVPNV